MKSYHNALLSIACLLAPLVQADSTRTRESFDGHWLFARYGLQADGSQRPEPGAPVSWSIKLTASTEEVAAGREHPANLAMDGDLTTRWCASDGKPEQWLMLDFGKAQSLKEVTIHWDVTAAWKEHRLPYTFVIETSDDGTRWTTQADASAKLQNPVHWKLDVKPRFLRVRTTAVGGSQWASIREVQCFDGDGKPIVNKPQQAGDSPSAVAFPDSSWRKLSVPHDWGIEGPFRIELAGNTGKLPWRGIGWYRKHFTLPKEDRDKKIYIDFDGAMAYAKVFCNGHYVGTWPYGYNSFRMDLTPYLKFGGENVLAVRLDTEKWDSRWYPGAGIYRHVWLVKTQPVHVDHWGTYLTTPEVNEHRAKIILATRVSNHGTSTANTTVRTSIFELNADSSKGAKIAELTPATANIAAGHSTTFSPHGLVPNPKLWDLENPHRYLAESTVSVDGKTTDVYTTPFGIRTIEFSAHDGFKLNGKRVPIRGTCNHHDLGALGAAVNDRALERQLEILKRMGCNSLRTSHNPPTPELLDLADRMGFLVWDEAFDCWARGKRANDYNKLYAAWHEKDLMAMVHRDRNHPSVIIWSIGNEVMEQKNVAMTKHLADIIRREDPTRPVSNGYNNPDGGRASGAVQGLDLMGVNYSFRQQDKWDKDPRYADMPTVGSETSSCLSSRGEYFFGTHRKNWQISSYDQDRPGWGCTPDQQFRYLVRWPNLLGEYVWTGFDYLGEPTPYNSDKTNLLNFRNDPSKRAALEAELKKMRASKPPSRSSYFGIIDLAGFPKDRYYLYQSQWCPDLPMATFFPIGTGRNASAKMCPCMSTPPATRPSCSSMASHSDARKNNLTRTSDWSGTR